MGMLLAFAPFIAFTLVDRMIGASEGLLAGAAVSAALLARDWISADRSPKILEIGTFVLFAGLALYSFIGRPAWSIVGVRLCVDAGLLVIVLVSLTVGRPFTLQYAKETVAPELWSSPQFARTNMVITAAWAVAFALLVVADIVMLAMPEVPHRFGIILTIAALVGAVKFTDWYPRSTGPQKTEE
ncbi:MAG: hypothetical protein EXQ83_05120 [Xanthobacteraceae bacterium]|nr:hypothetical protein [Xanthobacteraceae bacterium]